MSSLKKAKKEERFAVTARNDSIIKKLERSKQQVEMYIQNQRHQVMLKQTLRQLREEDMEKTRVRSKRKAIKEKGEIIRKELADGAMLATMRERGRFMSSIRVDHMNQLNFDKSNMCQVLDTWAGRGFSTSKTDRAGTQIIAGNPKLGALLTSIEKIGKRVNNDKK